MATLMADLKQMFPWMDRLGVDVSWLQNVAATAASGAEVVAQIRQLPQYQQRFPGLYRADGTQRMTEAQYIQTEDSYRQVLRQFGRDETEMNSPQDFVGLFEGEVDANEFRDRMTVYQRVQESGRDVRDAFYVYAGMRLNEDDLYAAAVDPARAQALSTEYNERVAASPFDYPTWISRAAEAGQTRVAETLGELQRTGKLTGSAVQNILQSSPDFARRIMDAIYTGGDPSGGAGFLSLNDLLSSYEFAAIGAAAKGAGLEMPDREQVARIRAAGVDANKAVQAYTDYGARRNLYAGMVDRLTRGEDTFTQADFEGAAFLGEGKQKELLDRATRMEESFGKGTGNSRIDVYEQGRLRQRGLGSI